MLQPKALDLNTLVAGTERMLRRLIGENIELTTALRADPGFKVRQALDAPLRLPEAERG